MQKINIGKLIEEIGPINNQIRSSEGYKRLSLMWDVGDILFKYDVKKIHPVAWEIYEKSYITRDLISYCYRIRKKWSDKNELQKLFKNLKSYSVFREALPFIENEKFILKDEQINLIIKWLNENDPKITKRKLVQLKKEYINIKNDRSKRLNEVIEEAKIFHELYSYILDLFSNDQELELQKIKNQLSEEGLLKLSQMCISISNTSYKGPSTIITDDWPLKFKEFVTMILPISQSKQEIKARFKRVISEEEVIQLADIFNSLRSGEPVQKIKTRLKIGLKLKK